MKKAIVIAIVLVLLGGAFYFYYASTKKVQAPVVENSQNQTDNTAQTLENTSTTTTSQQATSSKSTTTKNYSSGEEGGDLGVDISVHEVDFDGTSFSPATLNIKVGDWVLFKNKSQISVWPASNPHPTHTDYPGFDAKQAVGPGGRYQFQFTKIGSWGYHDHLNPAIRGTIVVSK